VGDRHDEGSLRKTAVRADQRVVGGQVETTGRRCQYLGDASAHGRDRNGDDPQPVASFAKPAEWDDAGVGEAERELVVAVGDVAGGSGTPVDVVLGLGPHHPSSHGVLRLRVALDGERITSAEPLVGHVHRGAEKLFEVRDYRQILTLANRHDWLSAFNGELGVALALERMLGLEVPARDTWIRTALAELNRILNHLAFAGAMAEPNPVIAAHSAAGLARNRVQAVMETATGGRLHFMATRIGGLRADVPARWCDDVEGALADVAGALPTLRSRLVEGDEARARLRGLGTVHRSDVDAFGLSGVVAQAAGAALDLRSADPYLAYKDLGDVLRPISRVEGDALARIECLLDQIALSIELVAACLPRIRASTGDPIDVRLPKVLRAPEGTTYAWTEGPLGINGYLLVSRGERTPWRLKMRTASFNNVSVLTRIVPGCTVDELVPLLQSMVFVIGDIDK
jgi:NADH-quinone oxidoreductase subunit D